MWGVVICFVLVKLSACPYYILFIALRKTKYRTDDISFTRNFGREYWNKYLFRNDWRLVPFFKATFSHIIEVLYDSLSVFIKIIDILQKISHYI